MGTFQRRAIGSQHTDPIVWVSLGSTGMARASPHAPAYHCGYGAPSRGSHRLWRKESTVWEELTRGPVVLRKLGCGGRLLTGADDWDGHSLLGFLLRRLADQRTVQQRGRRDAAGRPSVSGSADRKMRGGKKLKIPSHTPLQGTLPVIQL